MNYIDHVKEVGKMEELIAHEYAMGESPTVIAQKFSISRQAVYDNLKSYKKKLKMTGEEIRFYGKGKE